MTGLHRPRCLVLLALSLPLLGRAADCAAALSGCAAESTPMGGLDLLQKASAVRDSTVLLAGEDEESSDSDGDQDDEPRTADWHYYTRYVNGSGYVPEPSNETDDNETDGQPGANGTNDTGSPRDGGWPWPGYPFPGFPLPVVRLPDPVPCVSYNTSHPLVRKQLRGEELTHAEVVRLVEEPTGFAHTQCLPAPGTQMIRTKEHKKVCINQGWLYTVCFTARGKDRLRCGIFVGGAPARRAGGSLDCLGGCNEGRTSCNVRAHRGACFTHDVCSIVMDASGFTFHRDCGDEAHAAVRGAGKCVGPRGVRW